MTDIAQDLEDLVDVDKPLKTVYLSVEWEDGDFRTITHGDASDLLLAAKILELHMNRSIINGLANAYSQKEEG